MPYMMPTYQLWESLPHALTHSWCHLVQVDSLMREPHQDTVSAFDTIFTCCLHEDVKRINRYVCVGYTKFFYKETVG